MKIKNKFLSVVLSAFAISALGFVFLNLTFMMAGAISALINLFIKIDGPEHLTAIIGTNIFLFLAIAVITYFIFKSRWPILVKSAYVMVPLATVYVVLGASLYPWPYISYPLCGIIGLFGLYYLHKTKQPWQYWFSWVAISLTLFVATLAGVEI